MSNVDKLIKLLNDHSTKQNEIFTKNYKEFKIPAPINTKSIQKK